MLPPLVKTIEVPCGQETAFKVFVNDMATWWPLAKFSVSAFGGAPAQALRADAREGGEIVEVDPNGQEYRWGTFRTFDPFGFLAMDFHIPHPDEEPGAASLVEVRFTPLEAERTRVELTQSNWESLGEHAEMLRGGYGGGWTIIFEQAYLAACGGTPSS